MRQGESGLKFCIGGKSMAEHLETINHREAILFVEDLVSSQEPLSEWNIRNIHVLILKEIDNLNAGKYRVGKTLVISCGVKDQMILL